MTYTRQLKREKGSRSPFAKKNDSTVEEMSFGVGGLKGAKGRSRMGALGIRRVEENSTSLADKLIAMYGSQRSKEDEGTRQKKLRTNDENYEGREDAFVP